MPSLTACGYGKLPAQAGTDLVQLGRIPPTLHSPASGSSRKVAAKACCAAIASNPDQCAAHTDRAAGRSTTGAVEDRCRANRRSHMAASLPKWPANSTPTPTKRLHRAHTSLGPSGAVCIGQLRPRPSQVARQPLAAPRQSG